MARTSRAQPNSAIPPLPDLRDLAVILLIVVSSLDDTGAPCRYNDRYPDAAARSGTVNARTRLRW
jgi:hypothetical protein